MEAQLSVAAEEPPDGVHIVRAENRLGILAPQKEEGRQALMWVERRSSTNPG